MRTIEEIAHECNATIEEIREALQAWSVEAMTEEGAHKARCAVMAGWGSAAHLRGVIQGIIEDAERKYLIANPGIRSSDLRLHHVPATVSLHTLRGVMELLSPNASGQTRPAEPL